MGPLGPTELIVILVIALLVLGPKKLPEVGKSLGKGMREFKDSLSNANPFEDDDEDERPAPRRRPAQQVAAAPVEDPAEPAAAPAPAPVVVPGDGHEAQDAFGANKS
jgi:sec-independent protein translocase protein TatA